MCHRAVRRERHIGCDRRKRRHKHRLRRTNGRRVARAQRIHQREHHQQPVNSGQNHASRKKKRVNDPHHGHGSHNRNHKCPAHRLEKDGQQSQYRQHNKKQRQHQLIDFPLRALRLWLLIKRLRRTGRRRSIIRPVGSHDIASCKNSRNRAFSNRPRRSARGRTAQFSIR